MSDAAAGIVVAAIAADFGTCEQVDHIAVDGADQALRGAADKNAGRVEGTAVFLHAEWTAEHAAHTPENTVVTAGALLGIATGLRGIGVCGCGCLNCDVCDGRYHTHLEDE